MVSDNIRYFRSFGVIVGENLFTLCPQCMVGLFLYSGYKKPLKESDTTKWQTKEPVDYRVDDSGY